ncbi:MAG: KamA family radical SAM protein [Pirellulaceae bacterium]|nr:KamA family radical SAM protein [Pirellulaceae bacterium]
MLDSPRNLSELDHRTFRTDEFWRVIPGWKDVSAAEFGSHLWQAKHSIRKLDQVQSILGDRISPSFIEDIAAGLRIAPMNVRITPYVFSLIDWDNPTDDPLRMQFLPIASQMLPDHPYYMADSLYEDVDSPVPMLTHRYPDKVLFLPLTTCPVYCAYCTRSRIIGGSTESVDKDTYGPNPENWEPAFEYLRTHPQIEDVVISGGDAFNLTPRYIRLIGEKLLAIPHIRRLRYATKGVAILPMKILTDNEWLDALLDIHRRGRELGKQVVIHTHFSSPREITQYSLDAATKLFSEGVHVRNQAVLQEGVNNSIDEMVLLTRKLSYMNIQPYYVYIHDMVPGCEHLRTTLWDGVQLEKNVRGTTAGFNTPTFVCDAPGGGGKRHVASYEYYDRENGISAWSSPNVKPGELFLYFDPLHRLSPEAQARWNDSDSRMAMIHDVIRRSDYEISEKARTKIARRLEGGAVATGGKR